MASAHQAHRAQSREQAQSRLRFLTRGAILAAAGATAVIGVIVSREHPAGSSSSKGVSGSAATTTVPTTGNTGNSGNTGSSSGSSNTNSSSSAPTQSSSSPTVTSGGSSAR